MHPADPNTPTDDTRRPDEEPICLAAFIGVIGVAFGLLFAVVGYLIGLIY